MARGALGGKGKAPCAAKAALFAARILRLCQSGTTGRISQKAGMQSVVKLMRLVFAFWQFSAPMLARLQRSLTRAALVALVPILPAATAPLRHK